MFIRTKRTFTVVLGLLLVLGLMACAPAAAPAAPGDAPAAADAPAPAGAEGAKEIRFAWWGSAQRHELYNKLVDMIEEEFPDVTIVREFAGWDDYWDKLSTQAAGGNVPDLHQYTPGQIVEYAKRGVVMPLDDFVESGQIDLSDFEQKVIDAGKVDGKIYMVTKGISAPAVFTNVDMIERAGVAVPEEDMTWDEFEQWVIQVSEALGEDAWALQDSGGWDNVIESYMRQKGKKLISEDGTSLGFSKEDLIEWYSMWERLRQAGGIPPADVMAEEGALGFEDSMIVHGRVAMQIMNGNQLKIHQRFMPEGDTLTLLRIPRMPDGVNEYGEIITGAFLAMSANTEYPDDVAKIINYWINDVEFNKVYNLEHGISGSSVINDALAPTMDPSDLLVRENLEEVISTAPATEPRPQGFPAIVPLLAQGNEAIAFGGKSVEEAVDDVFAEAERLLK